MSSIEIENSSDFRNLDLTKVAALQQKRTLAFINQFVVSTVQFMNDFSKRCECRLMDFEKKLEKVEASLILLETKLSSIPELDSLTLESSPSPNDKEELPNLKVEPESQVTNEESQVTDEIAPSMEEIAPSNPEYDRFVKMVHVGVPLPAVKLKLSLEGLDPNVFDKIIGK